MENQQNQITQEEFYQAMALVVTKDDLKVALEKYATKDDLKNELLRYATKDDLMGAFERLERRIGNIEANIETNMMTKKDKEEIMEIFHKFIKKYSDWEVEKPIHDHDHRDMHDTLANHGKRIAVLEAGGAVKT